MVRAVQSAPPPEFVEAVRLLYELANGTELTADKATTPARRRQAERQGQALDLICDWLHAQQGEARRCDH